MCSKPLLKDVRLLDIHLTNKSNQVRNRYLTKISNTCIPNSQYVLSLVAAIEYLRQQQVAHRDIKPGNIMKYITPDGLPIYKLIDLGGAKHVKDDEEFKSLIGTEGFLVCCHLLPASSRFHPNLPIKKVGEF